MKTYNEIQALVIDWANERELIKEDNAPAQRLKLLEEVGETARAILKNDVPAIKDGIGDIFVVLIILAEQLKQPINFEVVNYESHIDYFAIFRDILDPRFLVFSIGFLQKICKKLDLDLEECINLAYNEIKNRKGITINGTFQKA